MCTHKDSGLGGAIGVSQASPSITDRDDRQLNIIQRCMLSIADPDLTALL